MIATARNLQRGWVTKGLIIARQNLLSLAGRTTVCQANFGSHTHTYNADVVLPRTPLKSSYVHGASGLPFLGGTIWTGLEERVRTDPHRVVYIYSGEDDQLTFAQLHKEASCLARGLMHLGVQKGDSILLVLKGDRHAITVPFAAAAIGAVFHMPYLFEPLENHLIDICERAGTSVIICGPSQKERQYEAVSAVLPTLQAIPGFKGVFTLTETSHGGFKTIDFLRECSTKVSEEDLVARSVTVDPDDPAYLLDSSGTTGKPKLVEHCHFGLLNSGRALANHRFRKDQEINMITGAPTYGDPVAIYMTAAVISADVANLCHVYTPTTDETVPGWTEDIAKAVSKYKCTHADIWPHAWKDIVDSGFLEKYDMSSLIGGITSGLLLSQKNVEKFSSHFKEFVNAFGTTETTIAFSNFPDDQNSERKGASLGIPLAHVEVKVVDESGKVVPIKAVGEFHIRSPYCFIRYVGQPELTEAAKDKSGWYHTGDIGYMDSDGFMYMLGRKKDAIHYKRAMVVSYPGPIEAVAKKHPMVEDAQCVGMKAESLHGDDIYLCIKPKNKVQLKEEDIRKHCEKELLSRDWPDFYIFMDEFPTVGQRKKISKEILRERIMAMKSSGNFDRQE